MMLIPSVDILAGRAVRLQKGSYQHVSVYEENPMTIIKKYIDAGYSFIHIVNLDKARGDANKATEKAIENMCHYAQKATIQMGGGLRSEEDIQQANSIGVDRFVISTLAVSNIEKTKEIMARYKQKRFTLALDVAENKNEYKVFTQAWQQASEYSLFDLLDIYQEQSFHLLCTDIRKDGMLQGTNLNLYTAIKKAYPGIFLQASGGVASVKDLEGLEKRNVDSVIVGKAIYEKKIDITALQDRYAR